MDHLEQTPYSEFWKMENLEQTPKSEILEEIRTYEKRFLQNHQKGGTKQVNHLLAHFQFQVQVKC